jgi:hypothetical protein
MHEECQTGGWKAVWRKSCNLLLVPSLGGISFNSFMVDNPKWRESHDTSIIRACKSAAAMGIFFPWRDRLPSTLETMKVHFGKIWPHRNGM